MAMRCLYCLHTLVPKKQRMQFIVHKCVNFNCANYLYNMKEVDNKDLFDDFVLSSANFTIPLHIYDSFLTLIKILCQKNSSLLGFSKHNAHIMFLCLTMYAHLGMSLRKTKQALKDLHNIQNSH